MLTQEKNLELHFQCSTPILAIDRNLYDRCREICELEGLAHDLIVRFVG